ncbi:hypothetical protein [Spirosoma litoris]
MLMPPLVNVDQSGSDYPTSYPCSKVDKAADGSAKQIDPWVDWDL